MLHLVPDQPARTVAGGEFAVGHAVDQLFHPAAVANEILDGDDLQLELLRQFPQLRAIGPVAVRVEDLDEHARRFKSRQSRQIDRGFGVPRAPQHSAFFRDQREEVSWANEI